MKYYRTYGDCVNEYGPANIVVLGLGFYNVT